MAVATAFVAWLMRRMTWRQFVKTARENYRDCRQDMFKTPMTAHRKAALKQVNRGKDLYNSKRYADALRAFQEAIDHDHTYARAHVYYGNALYKLHDQPEAVAAWERAIRMDPHSDAAQQARVKIERLRNKNEKAVREIEAHLKGGPSNRSE